MYVFQLTWDGPDSDLDIGLVANDGEECTADSCFYGQRHPDWNCDGVNGGAGDPSLDIDDLSGFGPERISLVAPTVAAVRVTVNYYSGFRPVTATMRVFVDGALIFEAFQQLSKDDLWRSCRIALDSSSASCGPGSEVIANATHCVLHAPTTPLCPRALCGGVECADGDICSAEQVCTHPGTGVACTDDAACASNEYCNVVIGECSVGCRDNGSCAAPQVCGADHRCSSPPPAGFGEPCTDASGCQSPLVCSLLTGTCAETCAVDDDCVQCTSVLGPCHCGQFGTCGP